MRYKSCYCILYLIELTKYTKNISKIYNINNKNILHK